jgi:hypothetical protein
VNADFAKVKKLFFDKSVEKAADRKTRAVLAKFGAFVRRAAKSSIRKRKAISAPGSPPSSHVGTLRDAILFSYDPGNRSVVIGPVAMGKGGFGAKALEEGGDVSIRGLRGGRSLHIQARPFMKPAFMQELPKVPAEFRGGL